MTPKHTAGPWLLGIGKQKCFHKGNRVAICKEWEDGEEAGEVTIAEVWPACGDSDIADGALIAAAPDLLAALKAMLNTSVYYVTHLDMARAAIAKAEGR